MLFSIVKVSETKRDEKKRLADEDATRRIKQLEEQVAGLGRQTVTLKQDEEALTREMDITGEAFEDLQEQNARLIKQLREKDDANFKLMSERIKLNQVGSLTQSCSHHSKCQSGLTKVYNISVMAF